MKKIKFLDQEYQAEKIIKYDDCIKGYSNDLEVFSFEGISDFSQYELLNEEIYDEKELSEKERLENLETIINDILLRGN